MLTHVDSVPAGARRPCPGLLGAERGRRLAGRLVGRLDGGVELGVAVGERGEEHLEGPRRERHATPEQGVEQQWVDAVRGEGTGFVIIGGGSMSVPAGATNSPSRGPTEGTDAARPPLRNASASRAANPATLELSAA